jgi:DNA polymerase III epsilon subunit-like protein
VWDTETTGLDPPIICQLAFVLVVDGIVAKEYDQILQLPVGVSVHWRAQKVHKLTTAKCRSEGVAAEPAVTAFCELAQDVLFKGGRVVGHQVGFDVRAVRETRRAWNVIDMGNNQPLDADACFCTLNESRSRSTLKDRAGRRKAFSNAELYEHFHGSPPTFARLHNAADDVWVTLLNYAAGVRSGWW